MPAVGSGCRRCGRSGIRNCWTSIAATCLPRYALPFDIGHGIGGLKLMAVCIGGVCLGCRRAGCAQLATLFKIITKKKVFRPGSFKSHGEQKDGSHGHCAHIRPGGTFADEADCAVPVPWVDDASLLICVACGRSSAGPFPATRASGSSFSAASTGLGVVSSRVCCNYCCHVPRSDRTLWFDCLCRNEARPIHDFLEERKELAGKVSPLEEKVGAVSVFARCVSLSAW